MKSFESGPGLAWRSSWRLMRALLVLALPLAVVGLARTSYKRVNLEFIEFGGQLSIDTKVRGDAKDLSAFLTPQRIVESAWNPANVERLPSPSEDRACFRLKQDEVTFVALRVNTYVDVDVVSVGDRGGVTLESKDIICKASWANQAEKQLDVRIKLVGELKPQAASGAARRRPTIPRGRVAEVREHVSNTHLHQRRGRLEQVEERQRRLG